MRRYGLPNPERRPTARASSRRSCGIDCHTRSVSKPLSSSCCQKRSAPSQPSLSCTAVTPRVLASLIPARIAVEVLLVGERHVALLEAPGGLLTQHAGRLAVRVALDDAAVDLEVATRERKRGAVQPQRVVVLGDHRRRVSRR